MSNVILRMDEEKAIHVKYVKHRAREPISLFIVTQHSLSIDTSSFPFHPLSMVFSYIYYNTRTLNFNKNLQINVILKLVSDKKRERDTTIREQQILQSEMTGSP